jgi:predicted anti-sigma-YlaC factor YlaD
MRAAPRISCDRTRDLVSSALDGRLHDLERRFLEAHLARCPDCKAFADESAWFTSVLRTAEVLRPVAPIVIPRRRRALPLRAVSSAAAAAIVLVLAGNVALTAPVSAGPERALIGSGGSSSLLAAESIRTLRRGDVVSGRLSLASQSRESSLGAVKPLIPAG